MQKNNDSIPTNLAIHHTFAELFPNLPGSRQIFVVNVEGIMTSCGFGVPLMEYKGERSTLLDWAEKKGEDGIAEYQRDNNRISLDGLPTGLKID